MTKAQIISEIANKTGQKKNEIQKTIDAFTDTVQNALEMGENVSMRGFGNFHIKYRAEKTARNISNNTAIIVPAHCIPVFKPAKEFVNKIKKSIKIS